MASHSSSTNAESIKLITDMFIDLGRNEQRQLVAELQRIATGAKPKGTGHMVPPTNPASRWRILRAKISAVIDSFDDDQVSMWYGGFRNRSHGYKTQTYEEIADAFLYGQDFPTLRAELLAFIEEVIPPPVTETPTTPSRLPPPSPSSSGTPRKPGAAGPSGFGGETPILDPPGATHYTVFGLDNFADIQLLDDLPDELVGRNIESFKLLKSRKKLTYDAQLRLRNGKTNNPVGTTSGAEQQ